MTKIPNRFIAIAATLALVGASFLQASAVSAADPQVNITATVDPAITFDVDAQASTTPCSESFTGSGGGTVALGVIPLDGIKTSDLDSVAHICTRVSSNATSGVQVTVKSDNAALMSTGTPADVIPSASGLNTMSIGTANYGICLDDTVLGHTGTIPDGENPSADIAVCAHATYAGDVTGVTTSAANLWHISIPTADAFQSIVVKAAISSTTPAHTDYHDKLTFVATGSF